MKGIIYIIKNNINGKVYIGQTIQKLKDRWYRHCGKSGLSKNE
jgi:predicted GIY-YIG superfamily endonuclease